MSLHDTYDSNNIFAQIIRGDMPCCKVYEDDDVLAFMDLFPQSPGHTLVIPKNAGRNLLDTDDKVLTKAIVQVKNIARAIDAAFSPDGLIITQFNGEPAGQTVFHLHFHIIPRFADQAFDRHGKGKPADREVLHAQAAKIAEAMKS
ncbi:MAG: HIT family protein [Robiginitomaculum sp.]|nr:MAG: HIT family protein [Robiginitomaculum sp.]